MLSGTKIVQTHTEYIFTNENGIITYDDGRSVFDNHEGEAMDVNNYIRSFDPIATNHVKLIDIEGKLYNHADVMKMLATMTTYGV